MNESKSGNVNQNTSSRNFVDGHLFWKEEGDSAGVSSQMRSNNEVHKYKMFRNCTSAINNCGQIIGDIHLCSLI